MEFFWIFFSFFLLSSGSCSLLASEKSKRVWMEKDADAGLKTRFLPLKMTVIPMGHVSDSSEDGSAVMVFKDPTFGVSSLEEQKGSVKLKTKDESDEKKHQFVGKNSILKLGTLKIIAKYSSPEVPFSKIEIQPERVQETIDADFIHLIGKNIPEL